MCCGSFFTPADGVGDVTVAGVLTRAQIAQKHRLTAKDLVKIENKLRRTKVNDALFSWPQGPYYDLLLNLIAFCG
jgi:hypothetical protein